MDRIIITNIDIFKAIADEAHQKMSHFIKAGRRPKADGSTGWIITYDPDRNSFKQAMISIVFSAMWLESLLHLLIVKHLGEKKFKECDRKKINYEKKLELLGCTDQDILDRVARFRKTRNSLVHEKAHFDSGEIITAQDEANNAHEMLIAINRHFSDSQFL